LATRGVQRLGRRSGEIAQLVEHTTENRGVPSSSLGLAILTTGSQAPGGSSSLRAVAGAWLSCVLCCVLLGACVSPPAAQGDDGPLGADAPTSAALWDWEALEQPLASRIDGISDQNLAFWGGSGKGPLAGLSANAWLGAAGPHLRYARYVVQWDVMSRRTREPYRHYYEAFVEWYREVHALGLSADVVFGLYTGAPPASADAYRSAIEELLSAFPVPYIEAFNEPNGTANLSAAAAAHFFNQAYGYCERHGCEAIAGDFLDTAGAASYALQYKRALSPTEYPRERDPPDWGRTRTSPSTAAAAKRKPSGASCPLLTACGSPRSAPTTARRPTTWTDSVKPDRRPTHGDWSTW
jgi:hypothetical protein